MSKLKRALHFLLYDNIDTNDLEINDDDDCFVDRIIDMSIEQHKEDKTCPYKNYEQCELCTNCNANQCLDEDRWDITCGDSVRQVYERWYKEVIKSVEQ